MQNNTDKIFILNTVTILRSLFQLFTEVSLLSMSDEKEVSTHTKEASFLPSSLNQCLSDLR